MKWGNTMEKKVYDVVALGELLIDFTHNGYSSQGNPVYEANPGGAPCNVLAMLRKLDKSCAFVGKVGDDIYGHQLKAVLGQVGIPTEYLLMDKDVRTTLAIVQNNAFGDREFSFYRNPGADMMLKAEEIPEELLKDCNIFHFGTLSMTHNDVCEATRKAVRLAKEAGSLISFDPNLRPPLWESLELAKERILEGLGYCDILKIADNELEFMTGETDFHKGAMILKAQFPNIKLLNVTAGAEGSYCLYREHWIFVPGFCLGGTIETTGAGDTFCASVLNFVLENGLDDLSPEQLTQMLRFANAAAYLVTTRKGAIRSMPEKEQVLSVLK